MCVSAGLIRENIIMVEVVFATSEGVTQLNGCTVVDCSRIKGDLLECFFDSLLRDGEHITGFRLGGNLMEGHSIDLLFQRVFPFLR